jgi:hypothetical protein
MSIIANNGSKQHGRQTAGRIQMECENMAKATKKTVAKKTATKAPVGAFNKALSLRGDAVLDNRANAIADDAALTYRQTVERLELEDRKLAMEQEALLDLAPDDANSLRAARDFDADQFVKKDIDLAVKRQVHRLRLEAARERLAVLFGA